MKSGAKVRFVGMGVHCVYAFDFGVQLRTCVFVLSTCVWYRSCLQVVCSLTFLFMKVQHRFNGALSVYI
jgi:hypothetical protein